MSSLTAADLGAVVIKEVLKRASVDAKDVDEVIMAQAGTAGQGQNPSRQASLKAGLPEHVPAYNINMLCGSGVKTVHLGYQSIMNGDAKIMICGGQESMSKAPHAMHLRDGVKMGNSPMVDTLINDTLTDSMFNIHMGVTAENLATKYSISREDQDIFAANSQNKAEAAQMAGYLDAEIVPVEIPSRKQTIIFAKDEYPKYGTTVESLSKLRPCFAKDGSVTPGNASGINDCAAAVLLMPGDEMKRRSLQPLARIVGYAQSGCDPKIMGIGPVPAIQKLLTKVGWKLEDVDLFELNEAFAAQSLAVTRELGVDSNKVNIHGGAIALGHPIAASGTRVLITLLYALQRTGGRRGIASLCVGGGMGVAIAVEREEKTHM